MAFGVGEDPSKSITRHLEGVEYPVSRSELVDAAGENEAPVEIINLMKNLPAEEYASEQQVFRDLAEAARRFGLGGHAPKDQDRRNLGRDTIELRTDGKSRHP